MKMLHTLYDYNYITQQQQQKKSHPRKTLKYESLPALGNRKERWIGAVLGIWGTVKIFCMILYIFCMIL